MRPWHAQLNQAFIHLQSAIGQKKQTHIGILKSIANYLTNGSLSVPQMAGA